MPRIRPTRYRSSPWLVCSFAVATLVACTDRRDAPTAAVSVAAVRAPRDTIGEFSPYDRYIVTLRTSSSAPESIATALGVRVPPRAERAILARAAGPLRSVGDGGAHAVYRHVMQGFAARLTREQVRALRADPRVIEVAPEHPGVLDQSTVQANAPWHLDRIDQRDGRDFVYSWFGDGTGVNVYVLDNGINVNSQEFGGRASVFADLAGGTGGVDICPNAITVDLDPCQHGMAVASLAGGAEYGVAKNATIRAVRYAPGWVDKPWPSAVVSAMDTVRVAGATPAVVVLAASYSSNRSQIDNSANALINAGFTLVVSAGNWNNDACKWSPQSVDRAIVVGASDTSDARAQYPEFGQVSGVTQASNYGPCVDVFAPGTRVRAAGSDFPSRLFSGTSASAPIVAGIAARYLSIFPSATPREVENYVKSNASPNRVVMGALPLVTQNLLAFAEPMAPTRSVYYQARVQTRDWLPPVYDSQIAGTVGQNLALRALRIYTDGPLTNAGAVFRYSVRFNGAWQAEGVNGSLVGTTGTSGTVSGLRVRLSPNPLGSSVCYQVHQAVLGWGPMACDNAVAGDPNFAVQAVRLYVVGQSSYGFRQPSAR